VLNADSAPPIPRTRSRFAPLLIVVVLCLASVQCRSGIGRTDPGPPELSHEGLRVRGLSGQVLFDGPSLAIPVDITIAGRYVVVADLSADSMFHVIDADRPGVPFQFGRRGSGPGEFENAWSMDPTGGGSAEFWVYDADLARMSLVSLNELEAGSGPVVGRMINLEVPAILTGPAWIDSFTMVSLGFFSRGRIAFISEDGTLIRTAGTLPEPLSSTPPEVLQHVFQATLALRPDRTLLAAATRHASNIEIYRADGSAVGVFQGPLLVEPRFEIQTSAGRPTMATGSDLRFGYIDVAASAEHIFALFSGRTRAGFPGSANFGRFVHVFDWSGNFEQVLELDASVLKITVDERGEVLYATRHEPEPAVMRYEFADTVSTSRRP